MRGEGSYKDEVFLIFRGTTWRDLGVDWLSNLYTGLNVSQAGSFVHAGFNQIFNSVLPELTSFMAQQTGITKVHCIGHSLGGAIANLAADWVKTRYGRKVSLYTFGAPRVGWGGSSLPYRLTTSLSPEGNDIFRVYHGCDPVPMLPVFPFIHAPTTGRSYFLPYGGLVLSLAAHKMESYIESINKCNQDWKVMYKHIPPSGLNIKAWLESSNDENARSSTFWQNMNHAIAQVLQLIAVKFQPYLVAGLTVVDYLTMLLFKGVKLAGEVAHWVLLLIRKIMRALGMGKVVDIVDLTAQLIRHVLSKLTQKLYSEARKAIEHLQGS